MVEQRRRGLEKGRFRGRIEDVLNQQRLWDTAIRKIDKLICGRGEEKEEQ